MRQLRFGAQRLLTRLRGHEMADVPVIWLNGAFGVGKTTVARALSSAVPDALVFDPEDLGLMLRKVVPPELRTTSDFQDFPMWRRLTRFTVEGLLEDYRRPLIVPMTVTDPGYFEETVGMLRRSGVRMHHFVLTASPKTIRTRLLSRLARPSSTLWALRQVQRCTTALQAPLFQVHLATDNVPVSEVVASIRREVSF